MEKHCCTSYKENDQRKINTKKAKGCVMLLYNLFEAYDYEKCEKYSGLDRDLCNWIRNEMPLTWSEAEIKQAREKYGNVPVGTVYRGLKINSKKLLERLQQIQREGKGTLELDLASATPDYKEAFSFALYVKSYDELTLMWELKQAYERGSAGKYGTAVVELQPSPSQVIVKTYEDGDEKKYNPNYTRPEMGLEQEVILHGEIPVKNIQIFYPLTLDGWQNVLEKQYQSIETLNNSFTTSWLQKNIPQKDIDNFGRELLPKLINSNDDIAKLLKINTPFSNKLVFSLPQVKDFIKKHFDPSEVSIQYKGKSISVPLNVVKEIEVSNLDATLRTLLKRFNPSAIRLWHKAGMYGLELGTEQESQIVMKIARIFYINPNLLRKHYNNPKVKEVRQTVQGWFDELLALKEKDLTSDQKVQEIRIWTTEIVDSLKVLKQFFSKNDLRQLINPVIRHILQDMAKPGLMDRNKTRMVELVRHLASDVIPKLLGYLKESDN